MKPRIMLASVIVLLLACAEARAVKILVNVSSKNAKDYGFTIESKPTDKGTLRVTISRDLAQARSFPPESELTIGRSALLTLYDQAGIAVKCLLEPRPSNNNKNVLEYDVEIGRGLLPHAHFTLMEIDEYKNPTGPQLLGGGTFFEVPLADFLKQ